MTTTSGRYGNVETPTPSPPDPATIGAARLRTTAPRFSFVLYNCTGNDDEYVYYFRRQVFFVGSPDPAYRPERDGARVYMWVCEPGLIAQDADAEFTLIVFGGVLKIIAHRPNFG